MVSTFGSRAASPCAASCCWWRRRFTLDDAGKLTGPYLGNAEW